MGKMLKTSWIICLLGCILVFSDVQCWGSKDPGKVLLRDMQVLTLKNGKMTTGKRSSPVPQLKCVGGSAQGAFNPQVVQCYNRGWDGVDVQWECKADMDNLYRFGEIEVVCEGYDYPDDAYITNNQHHGGAGGFSGGGNADTCGGGDTYTRQRAPGTGGIGGFWSGMATGGLLGYLFGGRSYNRTQGYGNYGYGGYNRGYGGGGGSWFGGGATGGRTYTSSSSSSSSSSGTRTASGFGGTRRR